MRRMAILIIVAGLWAVGASPAAGQQNAPTDVPQDPPTDVPQGPPPDVPQGPPPDVPQVLHPMCLGSSLPSHPAMTGRRRSPRATRR